MFYYSLYKFIQIFISLIMQNTFFFFNLKRSDPKSKVRDKENQSFNSPFRIPKEARGGGKIMESRYTLEEKNVRGSKLLSFGDVEVSSRQLYFCSQDK